MTTTEPVDLLFPPIFKQDHCDEKNDKNVSFKEVDSNLSMHNFYIPPDSNDGLLRVTDMVRSVYFAYLHKCLQTNYFLCYEPKTEEIPCEILKKCADEMELHALQQSVEVTLYRQNMLKMISDIKSHTSSKRIYNKLVILLSAPFNKIDVAVQTNNTLEKNRDRVPPEIDNIQSICITSNCKDVSPDYTWWPSNEEEMSAIGQDTETSAPLVHSTSQCQGESIEANNTRARHSNDMEIQTEYFENNEDSETKETSPSAVQENIIKMDNEDSQDSLMQHMEDMFCESDDSSDLMTLIERHSGVSKANVDQEISKMCITTEALPVQKPNSTSQSNKFISSSNKTQEPTPGKISLENYREMKNQSMDAKQVNKNLQNIQKQKQEGIWFVERVHRIAKLKETMTELSLINYRKHGRVKEKFVELFGESDDEDMMPDSPICIEEHLNACKERIAPMIVKYLMPLYNKKRIKDRLLFKAVAKHITDMLIIENTFPEPPDIYKFIQNYFKNKKCIQSKHDIYM